MKKLSKLNPVNAKISEKLSSGWKIRYDPADDKVTKMSRKALESSYVAAMMNWDFCLQHIDRLERKLARLKVSKG